MGCGCLGALLGNSENAAYIKSVSAGKTEEQKKVIEYFCKEEGCFSKNISDEEYLSMIRRKRDSLNLRKRGLDKVGLDEDEVKEIEPVMLEGFVYDRAYAKKRANGSWVSSAYQVTWLFFSPSDMHIYTYTFNMDEDKKKETTDTFFYRDVVSFSTSTETETAHGVNDTKFEIDNNKFKMVVPGDKISVSMGDVEGGDDILRALKQLLKDKKM